jgi:hypothetical protein
LLNKASPVLGIWLLGEVLVGFQRQFGPFRVIDFWIKMATFPDPAFSLVYFSEVILMFFMEKALEQMGNEMRHPESAIGDSSAGLFRKLTELESVLGVHSDVGARAVSTGEAAAQVAGELVHLMA